MYLTPHAGALPHAISFVFTIVHCVGGVIRIFFFNFFNVYLFLTERERERERMGGEGAERQRETQNPKQAPGSKLSAQSLTRGLNSQSMRS